MNTAGSSHLQKLSERLYTLSLWLYPPSFRRSYGLEMQQTFRACCRDALSSQGLSGLLRLWSTVGYDLLTTACIEHMQALSALIKRLFGLEKEHLFMSISLETAAQTDKGLKREQNEDNVLTTLPQDSETMQKKGALFVVADGLGGHSKGEVASALVVNTVNASYYQDTDHDISTALREAVTHANSSVYQENATEEQDEKRFMGATCIAVVLHDTHAYVANVGDSRAYVIRQGTIKQLTIDHSWVAEQVQAGTLTL